MLWKPVITSARRFRALSGLQLPAFFARMVFSPFKTFTRRASVEKIWYDSNREGDGKISVSLAAKVTNGIALLIVIVLVTGPVWIFLPRSLTPWGTPLGKMRFVIGTFLSHVGLIFWPVALIVFVHLFLRRYWIEWIKMAALTAFCFWLAWDSTQGVIWFWTWFGHRLAHFHNG